MGETIDLLRRTEEHTRQIDRGQRDWHQEWGRARDRVSYYFSGLCMNKSLALDLEDCLLRAYPVVYLHLWAGGDGGLRAYTGEANSLAERTRQHLNPRAGTGQSENRQQYL